MSNLDTPEGRLAAAQALGPQGYNEAMAKHIVASTIDTINGHPIRPVDGGRFGRLYAVGDPVKKAFATLEEARAYATEIGVDLQMFEISLTCGDIEQSSPQDAARAFRAFCLEADQHELRFRVVRQRGGEVTYVDLEPVPEAPVEAQKIELLGLLIGLGEEAIRAREDSDDPDEPQDMIELHRETLQAGEAWLNEMRAQAALPTKP